MTGKKLIIFFGVVIFLVGWFIGYSISEAEFPQYMLIRRHGKPEVIAYTSPELAKIVTMTDVPDPGVYIAFPIYSDHEGVARIIQ